MRANRLRDETLPNAIEATIVTAERRGTPAGTRIVKIACGVLLGASALLAVVGLPSADPNDPGLVDFALFAGPMVAFASGVVLGVLLVILAARRMIRPSVGRAVAALLAGSIVGPLLYLIVFVILWFALYGLMGDSLPVALFLVPACVLPVASAITVTLAVAFLPRAQHQDRPEASRTLADALVDNIVQMLSRYFPPSYR